MQVAVSELMGGGGGGGGGVGGGSGGGGSGMCAGHPPFLTPALLQILIQQYDSSKRRGEWAKLILHLIFLRKTHFQE